MSDKKVGVFGICSTRSAVENAMDSLVTAGEAYPVKKDHEPDYGPNGAVSLDEVQKSPEVKPQAVGE